MLLDCFYSVKLVGLRRSLVRQLGKPAAVILPGTKNTLSDLNWLHETGLAASIQALAGEGTAVVGLCGGFQMLGDRVVDEQGIESDLLQVPGLGLLPGMTHFAQHKTVTRSQACILAQDGFLARLQGQIIQGYEIHMGETSSERPFARVEIRESQPVQAWDGGCSEDSRIWGTYLHCVMDNDHLRAAWLGSLGVSAESVPFAQRRSMAYDRLADALETALDFVFGAAHDHSLLYRE